MRGLGIALMGVGVLIVLAALAPQVQTDALKYGLTALGPCVGGLGAWIKQEAGNAASSR